jgi:hypothetical protein
LPGSLPIRAAFFAPFGQTLPPVPVRHPVDNNVHKAPRPRQCWLGRRCLEIDHERIALLQSRIFFPSENQADGVFCARSGFAIFTFNFKPFELNLVCLFVDNNAGQWG